MQNPRFRSGVLTTGFISEEYPDGFQGAPVSDSLLRGLVAVGAIIATVDTDRASGITQQLDASGEPVLAPGDWVVKTGNTEHTVVLDEEKITVDGEEVDVGFTYTPGDKLIDVAVGNDTVTIQLKPTLKGCRITTRGFSHNLEVFPARIAHLSNFMLEKIPPDLSKLLICPMPGLLVKLHVKEGDEVQLGQPLATVEAMKMENILRAEKQAVVVKILGKEGDSLAVDSVILELD